MTELSELIRYAITQVGAANAFIIVVLGLIALAAARCR